MTERLLSGQGRAVPGGDVRRCEIRPKGNYGSEKGIFKTFLQEGTGNASPEGPGHSGISNKVTLGALHKRNARPKALL